MDFKPAVTSHIELPILNFLHCSIDRYGPTGSPEYEEQYPPAPGIQLQPVKDFVPLFFAFHCPHVCKGPFGASFISKTTTFLSELVQTCAVQAKKSWQAASSTS